MGLPSQGWEFQKKTKEKMFQFLKKKGITLNALGTEICFFSRSRLPSCITKVTFHLYRANFGGHFSLVIAKVLLTFCSDV